MSAREETDQANDEVCYTERELLEIDWHETNDGKIGWHSLIRGRAVRPPCSHDASECPARRDDYLRNAESQANK